MLYPLGYCFLRKQPLFTCKVLVTKLKRSSYIHVTLITVKSQSVWDIVTQFARESVGLCPFCGLYVREFELLDSNLDCSQSSIFPYDRQDRAHCVAGCHLAWVSKLLRGRGWYMYNTRHPPPRYIWKARWRPSTIKDEKIVKNQDLRWRSVQPPKWSPTLKWSPNRPRNDPHFSSRRPRNDPQLILGMELVFRLGIITNLLQCLRS